jgi:hypothetical protein
MSNQEFENYVALIGKLLQLTREQRDQISGELQDHLQMRVADLMSEGVAKQDAVAKALEEFGDAAVMAKNFQTVINLKRRRWMMRFATISMAGAFLAAILTMALWPDNARFGTPSFSLAQETEAEAAQPGRPDVSSLQMRLSDATQRDLKTEEALKQVVDLNYDETPFSEIMEELERKSNLNFMLHGSARDDSLTEDEPLTFRVSQLPLNKCLELMLVQKNAAYTIDEGVVVIISRDAAPDTEFMRLRMFDCRELVDVLPASVPIYPSILSTDGSIGGMGGGLFCIPQGPVPSRDGDPVLGLLGITKNENTQSTDAPVQAPVQASPEPLPSVNATLLNLVFTMVYPDSWEHANGFATAQVVNGILIVRQTESAIRKIENLLDDLRANVLPPGKSQKVSNRVPQVSKRTQPLAAKIAKGEPFGNSGGNSPFGKSPNVKDPLSPEKTKLPGNPFGK